MLPSMLLLPMTSHITPTLHIAPTFPIFANFLEKKVYFYLTYYLVQGENNFYLTLVMGPYLSIV